MRPDLVSTRLLRAGFAWEKMSSTSLGVDAVNRMRDPMNTCSLPISEVAVRRSARMSSALASS